MKGIKSRGNGQGSAVKTPDGKWKALAVIGYNDGKPVRKVKRGFATKAEALAYIPTLKAEKPKDRPQDLKLGEAVERWMKTLTVSQSTRWCYSAGLELFRELFYTKLREIEIDDLQECLTACEKGKRTRQNAKVALGLVYKWAIPRGFASLNLAQYLKVGDGEAPCKISFTDEQLEQIRQAASTLPFARIIFCHCYLGFRPTALLQLTADSYDPETHSFIGGIKTAAGKNRTVTVSPKIQPYIDELLERSHGSYIFGQDGCQISLGVYRSRFYETLDLLGFPNSDHRYTPHTCRHTFATLLKRVPAPDKDKLALIGHTDSAMLRYYQDVSISDLKSLTDRL